VQLTSEIKKGFGAIT